MSEKVHALRSEDETPTFAFGEAAEHIDEAETVVILIHKKNGSYGLHRSRASWIELSAMLEMLRINVDAVFHATPSPGEEA